MEFGDDSRKFNHSAFRCAQKSNAVRESEMTRETSTLQRRSSLVGTTFKHTRHGEIAGAVVSQQTYRCQQQYVSFVRMV